MLNESDVNKAYETFLDKLLYYYNKNIPLVKRKNGKTNKQPWITKGLMHSIKTRNKLYKAAVTTRCSKSFDKYKKYRNKLNTLIRLSRKMYYSQRVENNKNNLNGLWKTVNDLMGKNKKDNTNIFYDNGQQFTNPNDISNEFNTYFTNIGQKLASKIDNSNTNFTQFLPPYSDKSFFLAPTNIHEILTTVRSLKSSKSTGHDGLSVHLLKQIIYYIALPLTHIFNLSISTGQCPNSFKIAKVIPIYKKDDPSLFTNYRPISLLPSISIFLEKIIHKRLYTFLNNNNLLISNQFGFRKGHSTDYAIVQLLNKITESFTKKRTNYWNSYEYLSKGFDTIDHDILVFFLKILYFPSNVQQNKINNT